MVSSRSVPACCAAPRTPALPASASRPTGRVPRPRLLRLRVFPCTHTHRGISESPLPRAVPPLVGRPPVVTVGPSVAPVRCVMPIKEETGLLARTDLTLSHSACRLWHGHAKLHPVLPPVAGQPPRASLWTP
jgi:hypothetical protein